MTSPLDELPLSVGLCARCRHRQLVTSARGSRFVLCQLARHDKRFPKYPILPVLRCTGFDSSPEPRQSET